MLWACNQLQAVSIPPLPHQKGSRASGQRRSWKGLTTARLGKKPSLWVLLTRGEFLPVLRIKYDATSASSSTVSECDSPFFTLEDVCIQMCIYTCICMLYIYTSLIWNTVSFIDTECEGQTFSIFTETSGIRPLINLVWDLRRLDHILAVVVVTTLPWCLVSQNKYSLLWYFWDVFFLLSQTQRFFTGITKFISPSPKGIIADCLSFWRMRLETVSVSGDWGRKSKLCARNLFLSSFIYCHYLFNWFLPQ